jgi:ABC-type polysaccharide/polyol phosphate transport system ATPase subunit
MSSDVVISVENLSKCYQIYDSPRDRLLQMLFRGRRQYYQEFWALRDIAFQVRKGESVGIIGCNGCGKSTLLQLVCGTLAPTGGQLRTQGRIAALLELGIGFNPEFTGLENVLLNGALFGFSKAEMQERLEAIQDFAGIGDFINQPVKMYSSGMTVRLAFSVATNVEADILLVDEALSVGDAAFQFKCLRHMDQLRQKGTTVLFVSHDMSLVQSFCNRVIYLQNGRIKAEGSPEAVAAEYFFDTREQHRQALGLVRPLQRQTPLGDSEGAAAFGNGQGEILSATFADGQARQVQFPMGKKLCLEVEVRTPCETQTALAVAVQNHRLVEVTGRRFDLPASSRAHRRLHITLPGVFAAGDFFITLRLVQQVTHTDFMPLQSQIAALHFQVVDPLHSQDFLGICRTDITLNEVSRSSLRVVALLAVRNEAAYLERCLRHLVDQNVDVLVIDNDSTDDTLLIAQKWLGRGVIGIENYPYPGHYDWQGLLRFKETLARKVDADWFIHHDADEIRQSRCRGETLVQAITRLDAKGYNAIDFDEFVYLPMTKTGRVHGTTPDNVDYVRDYVLGYYFAPGGRHRVNAWKKTGHNVDLVTHGGHRVDFPGLRLAPERLVLRHYPCLSEKHLADKYGHERIYSQQEIEELGWHGSRATFALPRVIWPSLHELSRPHEQDWPIDSVWTAHPFLGDASKPLLPVPFIVGVGRSGTTLLRLMLDAHPELAIPAETHFLASILDFPPRDVDGFLETVMQSHTWNDFHIDAEALRARLESLSPFSIPQAIRAFYVLYAQGQGKPRWGDKTPPYGQYVDRLADLLPEVRIIHVIRDGRDVALSYKDKWFGPEDKSMDSLAAFWQDRILLTRTLAESLPDSRYLEIRFEDLVRMPEKVLEKVCGFLSLSYDPSMLTYHRRAEKRLQEMSDHYSQGRKIAARNDLLRIHEHTSRPPDPAQIEKWPRDLDQEDIAVFEAKAGELLQQLGYRLSTEGR